MDQNTAIQNLLGQINILTQNVSLANDKVISTRKDYDVILAWESELDRQRIYHINNKDEYNAGIVSEQLHTVRGEREVKGVIWERAKTEYNEALRQLTAAKESLTQTEKDALTQEISNNALITQANAAASMAESDARTKATQAEFFAKNTKYFIVGAVVLVIAIAAIIYFKRKKKIA